MYCLMQKYQTHTLKNSFKISNTYFEKFLQKYFDKIFQFFGFYSVERSINIKI